MSDTPTTLYEHSAVVERLRDCGPVTLCSEHLTNPRAFKYTPHPLTEHFDALSCFLGDGSWRLRDKVWRILVETHLVPVLNCTVELGAGSYNSALAVTVDGLSDNDDIIQYCEVVADGDAIVNAFLHAVGAVDSCGDTPSDTEPPRLALSTVEHTMAGLIGRRVEVTLHGAEPVAGRVLAWRDGALVLRRYDGIAVVPAANIILVSTHQLISDELDITD